MSTTTVMVSTPMFERKSLTSKMMFSDGSSFFLLVESDTVSCPQHIVNPIMKMSVRMICFMNRKIIICVR